MIVGSYNCFTLTLRLPRRESHLASCLFVGLMAFFVEDVAALAAPQDQDSKPNSACKLSAGNNKCAPADAFSKPYGSHLAPILESVHATPEQRTSISAVVESFRPKIEPLRQSYQQKRQEFLTGLGSGLASTELMARQTDLSQLYCDISCQYCRMSLEIRKQLKPEQIVLYEEYRMKQGWSSQKAR